MKLKKVLSFSLAVCMVGSIFAGCNGGGSSSAAPTTKGSSSAAAPASSADDAIVQAGQPTPRNETLYFDGLVWAPNSNSFNPMNPNPTSMGLAENSIAREVIFETLYMYNQLDGKQYPLLADGAPTWNGDECTVKIKSDAKWSDGQKVTADDVVYTFELSKKYSAVCWSNFWQYLDSVTKKDDSTVVFKEKAGNKNPLMVEEAFETVYIMPQHIWSALEQKDNNDYAKLSTELNSNPVGSGPYKVLESNDQKVVLYRDSKYWGQAQSMWGKLPAPKYLVHNIYKDNDGGNNAFKQNEVDVSQQFMPNIQSYGATAKTFLTGSPYYLAGTIPFMIFNTTKSGLDNKDIRKAIAMSVNYDQIGKNAMSGYTMPMLPSLLLRSDVEQKLVDENQLKSLQWTSTGDVAKANALLDSAGAKKGSDGIRVYKGKKLAFKVECPTGWTDWNAALEVVANSSKAIGLDITTYFPQAGTWTNDMQNGNFDIIMNSYQGSGSSSPWMRAYQCMDSNGIPAIGSKANQNYGRYKNPEADKILDRIPNETGDTLVKDWTELNKIYLTDMPAAGLMYRPTDFHTVNESVWTGFPVMGDGTNIPPQICIDGYGVAALYHIHAK